MTSFDSYAAVRKHKSDTCDTLEWHFTTVVKSIHRKISLHQRYKNPWKITISEKIKFDTFLQFYKAVRDFRVKYGRTINLEKYKNQSMKTIVIKFTHLGALKFHLNQITNGNIKNIGDLFEKKLSNENKGTVVVTDEKPATLTYKVATHMLTIDISYEVCNRYGNICSF